VNFRLPTPDAPKPAAIISCVQAMSLAQNRLARTFPIAVGYYTSGRLVTPQ
jgi:hypothetical protein